MLSPTRVGKAGVRPVAVATFLTGLAGIAAVVHRPAKAERGRDSCPLTVAQEVAAVKAFKGFAPIFREPRCLNCHGAVNPFAENGGHLGGHIDIREEAQEFLSRPDLQEFLSNTPPDQRDQARIKQVAEGRQEVTDNDFIKRNAFFPMHEACKQCHIDAWIIPFKEHHFVNKSDEELCLLMKTSELTNPADRFLQHMQADELVLEGFKGTRGLESAVTPIPPAMPFAALERFVNDWVEAMDGKFHKPPDCGCKIHGLVLQIHHRSEDDPKDVASAAGEVDFSSDVDFAVRLTPVQKTPGGWLTGQASVVRPIVVSHVAKGCSGKASRKELWDFRAVIDDDAGSVKIQYFIDPSAERGTLTCWRGGYKSTDELKVSLSNELMHRDHMMPIAAGATKEFRANDPHRKAREWLTVTVLQGSEPEE